MERNRLCTAMSPSFHRSASRRLMLSSSSTSTAQQVKNSKPTKEPKKNTQTDVRLLNLSTVTYDELETFIITTGHKKYRAKQIWHWIREQGITDPALMKNIPATLKTLLTEYTKPAALTIAAEDTSKDGTMKRAYTCHDGQVIESVLMPYADGRYTACISSQAGCAQGCVFCATGQMGFSRQLTSDEIFEQVALFSSLLQQQQKDKNNDNTKTHGRSTRLSNVVFMGMGEPLANYRNVVNAINRINTDLGISARRITVSTVGIVPNIYKLAQDPAVPKGVRLAVSLHCATDHERNELLPANHRYGGLHELMCALREYMHTTGNRITLEWALIAGQNDSTETAQELGNLIVRSGLRRDMVHVNVIPLNPTTQYQGSPTQRAAVNLFCQTLTHQFKIACTPRVRRGIDIDAGCGQLKAQVLREQEQKLNLEAFAVELDEDDANLNTDKIRQQQQKEELVDNDNFVVSSNAVDIETNDYADPEYHQDWERQEAKRLINLVKGTTVDLSALEGQRAPKQAP